MNCVKCDNGTALNKTLYYLEINELKYLGGNI